MNNCFLSACPACTQCYSVTKCQQSFLLAEFEKKLASPDYEKYWACLESWTETWRWMQENRGAPERAERWTRSRRNNKICTASRFHQVSSDIIMEVILLSKKNVMSKSEYLISLCKEEGWPPGLDVPGPCWSGLQRWVSSGPCHWQADHRPIWGAWERSICRDWPPAWVHFQPHNSCFKPRPGCQDQRRSTVWNQVGIVLIFCNLF